MEICIETCQKRIDVFEYSGKKTHLTPICVVFFLVFFAPSTSVLFQTNGQWVKQMETLIFGKSKKVLDIRSKMMKFEISEGATRCPRLMSMITATRPAALQDF